MDKNKFAALVYSDLFDYPLTKKELNYWEIKNNLQPNPKNWDFDNEFFFIKGRKNLVILRKNRGRFSQKKHAVVKNICRKISQISTIEAIFLTGSLAMSNAKEEADIDLMVVCSPNTIWRTRLKLLKLLKSLKIYRDNRDETDKICPNIFLDLNNLEIKNKNIFTAHEVLQAKCLFDRGGVERLWLEKNEWTKEFLPKAYKVQSFNLKFKNKNNILFAKNFSFCLLPFEFISFFLQYLYMFPKITNEKVGWGYAFFHPRDLSSEMVKKFEQRLVELN